MVTRSGIDGNEMAVDGGSVRVENAQDTTHCFCRRRRRRAQEYDRFRIWLALGKDHTAKLCIEGHQDRVAFNCVIQDATVISGRQENGHAFDLVAGFDERGRDSARDILIDKYPHYATLDSMM